MNEIIRVNTGNEESIDVKPWKKILFVFNPVAGRSQIRNHLLEIIEILSAADYMVVCYPTRSQGDARRIVREREDDYLYVVCAGGDGTLDEVVSGMMENPNKPFVPIGYIPAGLFHICCGIRSVHRDLLSDTAGTQESAGPPCLHRAGSD